MNVFESIPRSWALKCNCKDRECDKPCSVSIANYKENLRLLESFEGDDDKVKEFLIVKRIEAKTSEALTKASGGGMIRIRAFATQPGVQEDVDDQFLKCVRNKMQYQFLDRPDAERACFVELAKILPPGFNHRILALRNRPMVER